MRCDKKGNKAAATNVLRVEVSKKIFSGDHYEKHD